jgi:hypothetical protein
MEYSPNVMDIAIQFEKQMNVQLSALWKFFPYVSSSIVSYVGILSWSKGSASNLFRLRTSKVVVWRLAIVGKVSTLSNVSLDKNTDLIKHIIPGSVCEENPEFVRWTVFRAGLFSNGNF